jgi:hypothetical protein
MRSVTVMSVLAGCASMTLAQNFELWLEPSSATPGATFTVGVYGSADVGDAYRAGNFGLSVDSLDGSNRVSNITWDLALGGPAYVTFFDLGYGGDGVHLGVQFGQLFVSSCGFIFDCGAPYGSLIGTFTVVMDPLVAGDYEISLITGQDLAKPQDFTFEVYDELSGSVYSDDQGLLTLTGAQVSVVPSQGTLGLLGCCGLLVSRRRR